MIKITKVIRKVSRKSIPRGHPMFKIGKKKVYLTRKQISRIYFQLGKFFLLKGI